MTFAVRVARGGFVSSAATRKLFRKMHRTPAKNPTPAKGEYAMSASGHRDYISRVTNEYVMPVKPSKAFRKKKIARYKKAGIQGIRKDFLKEASKPEVNMDELARIQAQLYRVAV